MPATGEQKNQGVNPEELYQGEEMTPAQLLEQKNATELTKARAAKRRQMEQEEMGARTKIPTLAEKEAVLIEQEYGRPTETPPTEEEISEEGEEGYSEEEAGEGSAPEQKTAGGTQEEMAYQAETARRAEAAEKQIRLLRTRSLTLNRQIRNASITTQSKLKPAERALKASKIKDRTVNLIKIIKVLGGIAGTLWYTIVIPLLMILLIIGCFILWLCGFNLGRPSLKTMELKQKLRIQKQALSRERDRQIQPMKRELQNINKKINQVSVNITA